MASESEFDQIKRLEAEIADAQSSLKGPGLDADQKEDIRYNISELKEELKEVISERVEGWQDLFRKEPAYSASTGFHEDIYEELGCKFKIPNKTQVKQILEVLDTDHPGWEQAHGYEAFFATLVENFPELQKQERQNGAPSEKKGGGGCLVVALCVGVPCLFGIERLIQLFG